MADPQVTPEGSTDALAQQSPLRDLMGKVIRQREQELVSAFRPHTPERKAAILSAVQTLIENVVPKESLISSDTISTIKAVIAELDAKLSGQINEILHHPDFQKLEGAWRGLHYLVSNTQTGPNLQIKVMNISKTDLAKSLKGFRGARWDQSPLFKAVYTNEYMMLGGVPYGCLVGDYYFDHSAPDVGLLSDLSKIGAAAFCPFISAANPSVMGLDSWEELANPENLARKFIGPEHAGWRSLRESEDSRYLALTLPRFLSRIPYGSKTTGDEDGFTFEEETGAGDHSRYTWANAAYAMAANITWSFKEFGWCTSIRGVESGGTVAGLPVHAFKSDDGGVDMKCPTEVAIDGRRDLELSDAGFMALNHRKNTDNAAFIGAQTLQKPQDFHDADSKASAALSARLPYIFASCRFAHYLQWIVRDRVGSFNSREQLQRELNEWIFNYVDGDPAHSTQSVKAQKPLADAQVIVEDVEGNPGAYTARFNLKPHFQLESVAIQMSLVAKIPSGKS